MDEFGVETGLRAINGGKSGKHGAERHSKLHLRFAQLLDRENNVLNVDKIAKKSVHYYIERRRDP